MDLIAVILKQREAVSIDGTQRRTQIMRNGIAECFQFLVSSLQFGVRFFDFGALAGKHVLGLLAFANVANGAANEHAVSRPNWTKADFHRKLGAVLAQAVERKTRTHGPEFGTGGKPPAMAGMVLPVTFGQKH